MFLFEKSLTWRRGGAEFAKCVRYLCVLFLFASFLVLGCEEPKEEENKGFIPVGEWTDDYGGGYDINDNTLRYYSAYYSEDYPGGEMTASIVNAIDFSDDSGVLIIKITEDDNMGYTVGKFTGVYYKDYTSSHVYLANPIDASYAPIEKDTLAEAESTFNVDNVDTHVTMWGSGYSK